MSATVTVSAFDQGDHQVGVDASNNVYIVSDGTELQVTQQWGGNFQNNTAGTNYRQEAVAVVALKNESTGTITGYKLAVKTTTDYGNGVSVRWDVRHIDTSGRVMDGTYGPNGQYTQLSVWNLKGLADYEGLFGQDLNGDGDIGLKLDKLTLVATDTANEKLARGPDQDLYLVKGVKADGSIDAVLPLNDFEYASEWSGGYSKREAVAIVAERDASATVTGYRILLKQSYKDSSNAERVTYDVLSLDTSGKQSFGMATMYGGNDKNLYGLRSTMSVETLFDQDLNGDGVKGVNLPDSTRVATDTKGVALHRESATGALFLKDGSTIKELSQYFESNYGMGSETREAMAIEAIVSAGSTTGYKLALKRTQSDANKTVSYEVITLDLNGRQAQGTSVNGTWVDSWQRDLKNLNAHEDFFQEDFNKDGVTGFNVDATKYLTTDTQGARLNTTDGGLYIVTGANKAIEVTASNGLYIGAAYGKEAFAVEAVKNAAGTVTGYKLLVKAGGTVAYAGSTQTSTQPVSYEIHTLDDKGRMLSGSTGADGRWVETSTYNIKSLMPYEKLFNEDFNGDKTTGITLSALTPVTNKDGVQTDTDGAILVRDDQGGLYVASVDPTTKALTKAELLPNSGSMEYDYPQPDGGYNRQKVIAIQAASKGDGYWLATERSSKWGTADAQVTYDILRLDNEGKQTYGMAAMAYPAGGSAAAGTASSSEVSSYGVKSLTPYEKLFNEDFNRDGTVGVNLLELDPITNEKGARTDTAGVILVRDDQGGLYVASVDPATKKLTKADPLPNSGWLEYSNKWGEDNLSKREAVAIQETRDTPTGPITGYKIAFKQTSKWGAGTEQVSYDIYTLGVDGKQVYGSMVNGQWKDPNVYGAKSLVPYEKVFNEDFNGDGATGVVVANLTVLNTDKRGWTLRRDGEKALYVVNPEATDATPLVGTGWMESEYSWGNGYNKREAIAIEGVKSDQDALTGYRLILKNVNKWDANAETVTYDILSLDLEGRQVYGSSVNGVWSDSNVYGIKSLTPYEDSFKEDFNNDGFVGIDPSKLTPVDTDTAGVKLARDPENGLYILDGKGGSPIALTNASGLEYSNTWTSGSYKREALAVEAVKEGGVITGYKLAMKSTNKYDNNPEQVSYDLLHLDATGKMVYGMAQAGGYKELSSWGLKSLAPYEDLFDQDFNGDGYIGIDPSKLTVLDSDSKGMRLARDTDKGLYIVDAGLTQAVPVTNAGWLEYSNSWGTDS